MRKFGVCIACLLAVASGAYAAVPTAAECKAAREKLAELTADDYKALKAKSKTNEQVGDALMGYAANEEKPAGKFVLAQKAFEQYVLGKSFEKADEAYSKAQADGGTEYALAVARPMKSKLSSFATGKFPAAKALKQRIAEDEKAYRRVNEVKAQIGKDPGNLELSEKLGVEYAAIGEWEGALAAFATAQGEIAKVAAWELDGGKGTDYTEAKVADFWWKTADDFPKRRNVEESLKLHAAMWYKLALDKDAFKGNQKTIVEKRVAETEQFGAAERQEKELAAKKVKELLPIALELKKDNPIVFVGCPEGEFWMGDEEKSQKMACINPHKVKITRPFWLSRYKVTKKQWNAYHKVSLTKYDEVMGGMNTPYYEGVSYNEALRFCEWLTKKFKNRLPKDYVVRLPTEAEWEWGVKANDMRQEDLYHNPEANLNQIAVLEIDIRRRAEACKFDVSQLKYWELQPIEVGTKKPNGLGLYDMLGNGYELMLDVIDVAKRDNLNGHLFNDKNQKAIQYKDLEIDPLRYCEKFGGRALRRGALYNNVEPSLYAKVDVGLDEVSGNVGRTCIRLCIGPDLMREKGYDKKSQKKR